MPDSIPCPINEALKEHAERPAIQWGSRRISYAQLNQYVDGAVRSLKERGLRSSHRVAFVSDNSTECVVALLGLWRLGAVAVPISPKFPPQQIKALLTSLKIQAVITSKPFMNTVGKPPCSVIDIVDLIVYDAKDAFHSRPKTNVVLNPDQEAAIVLTSGSSGAPKAAVLTYGNLYFNASGANEHIKVDHTCAWLLSLPLYHVSGLGIVLRCLIGRAAIAIAPREDTLKFVIQGKVTHVSLVAAQLHRLLGEASVEAPSNLRAVLMGGSAMPKDLLRRAQNRGFPIYVSYGLTEMASQVATGKLIDMDTPCAKVLTHRELRIMDGEICVRGKTLFKGYAEGDTVRPAVDGDGWFHTGDAGALDAGGYLTVTGRKDNMFVSGGENIHPEEIEAALMKIKSVVQAVVVPVKDAEFGGRPAAFIRWEDDIVVYKDEILREMLAQELPKFKIPIAFYAWPKEAGGEGMKIDRKYFSELIKGDG